MISKLLVISLVFSACNAGALLNGLSGGLGGSLGFSSGVPTYASVQPVLTRGYAAAAAPAGPLLAAIQSRRTYEVVPVALSQEPAVPQVIEVDASEQPVTLIFRSISSPVQVQQIHAPGEPGQYDATKSEDAPHKLVHEVYKPVIQEVREVIQPLRRVVQEVKPVLEEVHTVVAKGEPRLRTAIAPVAVPVVEPAIVETAPAIVEPVGQPLAVVEEPLAAGYGYKKAAKKA